MNPKEELEKHLKTQLEMWQIAYPKNEAPESYLGLSYGDEKKQFEAALPPLLCMVGEKAIPGECVVIITMEPRRDTAKKKNTFEAQQRFLKLELPALGSPNVPKLDESAYLAWNLNYFEEFGRILQKIERNERYWVNIAELMRGWFEDEHLCDWGVLSRHCIEIPLIPVHARTNSGNHLLNNEFGEARRKVFRATLKSVVERFRPQAILALGAPPSEALFGLLNRDGNSARSLVGEDQVGLKGHGNIEEQLGPKFFHPIYRLSCSEETRQACPVFARRAPFSNGWAPKRPGILRLGKVLRKAASRRHE